MQCINFDEKFEQYVTQWMEENAAAYRHNVDRMEAQMPAVYQTWCETPADWLSGISPRQYFLQYDSASMLVAWMIAYIQNSVPIPDQLLERITMLGEKAVQCLLAILEDETHDQHTQVMAITLLNEMDSILPMTLYIHMIANSAADDERIEHAAQSLTAIGPTVVAPILQCVHTASRAGREVFLDILCNFPGEEAIFALAVTLFMEEHTQIALHASLLGKLGDSRALPVLADAICAPGLAYLDYIEIRNAIETLGGEAPERSDFSGDVGYESLRRMK